MIESGISSARAHAEAALKAALETGRLLNEVRSRIEKGQWLEWLAKHCPDLPRSTAYRYLDLSRKWKEESFSHVGNGPGMTLRKAIAEMCSVSVAFSEVVVWQDQSQPRSPARP